MATSRLLLCLNAIIPDDVYRLGLPGKLRCMLIPEAKLYSQKQPFSHYSPPSPAVLEGLLLSQTSAPPSALWRARPSAFSIAARARSSASRPHSLDGLLTLLCNACSSRVFCFVCCS